MRRARERIGERAERSFGSRLESLLQTREQKCTERLAARNGEGIDVIPVECVDWLESANASFRGLEVHCHLDGGGNLSGPDESQNFQVGVRSQLLQVETFRRTSLARLRM
jgi:hypothetical protein